MASREIRDLSPRMQVLYNKFNDRCRRDPELLKRGAAVILTCTYRSNDEQQKAYNQGRTPESIARGEKIVTKAKPGESKHNCTAPNGAPAAEAFDVAILQNGKLLWDDTPHGVETWNMVGAHGQAVGLKWYGAPDAPFREGAHFQNPEV